MPIPARQHTGTHYEGFFQACWSRMNTIPALAEPEGADLIDRHEHDDRAFHFFLFFSHPSLSLSLSLHSLLLGPIDMPV